MDGASKFVRGDAIAGLIITAINIVGGLVAGVLRDHLGLGQRWRPTPSSPSATAWSRRCRPCWSPPPPALVTRAEGADLGTQMSAADLRQRPGAHLLGCRLGRVASSPACPRWPLGPWRWRPGSSPAAPRRRRRRPTTAGKKPVDEKAKGEQRISDLLTIDALELEVGYALLPLIDLEKGGELPGRVTALRRQLATDLGIVLPSVHLRDNLRLEPNDYRVMLRGMEIGRGTAYLGKLMCLEPAAGNTGDRRSGGVRTRPSGCPPCG